MARRRSTSHARLLLMLTTVVVAGALAGCGGGDTISFEKGEVLLEQADDEGREPFLDEPYGGADESSSADDAQAAFADFASDAVDDADDADADDDAELRTKSGDLPGLYGGSGSQSRCDVDLLRRFLAKNPDKARAWVRAFNEEDDFTWVDLEGGAHGYLARKDIPEFLDSLTPLMLTADTRVTNHGYRDGRAIPLQSVLQAGTAVFVDLEGVPRIRCACGNPLTEPAPVRGEVTYVGTRWKWFGPTSITAVTPSITVISIFTIRDPRRPDDMIPVTPGADGTATSPDDSHGDDEEGGDTHGGDTHGDTDAEPSTDEDAIDPDSLGAEETIFDNGNIGGIVNGGRPVTITIDRPVVITYASTYHWNDAQGAAPGTIFLKSTDGETVASWPTTGAPGQGGVPNAYWNATTETLVDAGTYILSDSGPATWGTNDEMGGFGATLLKGRYVNFEHGA